MRSSLCLLLLIAGSSAFTSNVQRPLNPSLSVGIALDWNSQEDEAFLMEMAEACASDDTCSLEDAQNYLDNVIRIFSCLSVYAVFYHGERNMVIAALQKSSDGVVSGSSGRHESRTLLGL